jgi:putative peptidoglycan lipid II flippase
MNLVRSALTVSAMTAASRLLGFVRDILIASHLGTGPVADAFFVAFRLPNLFRRLFAEGAFNSAFVPLYSGRREAEGAQAARRFAGEVASVLLWSLIIFTAACELAMPLVVHVIAPGFTDTTDKFDLTTHLSRITFPYLALLSLVALTSGILNAVGRFSAAAAAPIALNVVLILALTLIGELGLAATPPAGEILAWGVALAGLAQLALVWVAARRAGVAPHFSRPRLTPGTRRLIALGIPGVFAAGATQINIVIGTIIASFQDGAVSFLYYADRIYQLPLGVVGIAIGVVLLPDLSRRLAANDGSGALTAQNRACELSMLLTLPAAVALVAIPGPIISVLFEHGHFGAGDTAATAPALAAFAAGLPAFVLAKVFQPGFFAREDTRTPMWFAIAGVAVNIAGSIAMFPVLGHIGIAVATSLGGWLTAALLIATLMRRRHYAADARLKRRLALTLASSITMGLTLLAGAELLAPQLASDQPPIVRAAGLAVLVAAGVALFAALAELTGAASLRDLAAAVRRRPAP